MQGVEKSRIKNIKKKEALQLKLTNRPFFLFFFKLLYAMTANGRWIL